jgi:hypothetical protein
MNSEAIGKWTNLLSLYHKSLGRGGGGGVERDKNLRKNEKVFREKKYK